MFKFPPKHDPEDKPSIYINSMAEMGAKSGDNNLFHFTYFCADVLDFGFWPAI